MNIKIILSFIAFTMMFGAFGQNNSVIDSLENVLRTAKEDTAKVDYLNELSKQYRNINDNKMSLQYAESALELAKTLDFKKGISDSYQSIGNINQIQGNYAEALENYFAALKIKEELGEKEKRNTAYCYNNIGLMYAFQGNYPEAIENLLACLKISEEIGDTINMVAAITNIGNINQIQGNYAKALENFFAALKLSEECMDKSGIASSYNNIGIIYDYQGNDVEALENYFASLKIKEEIGNKLGMANTYINIGQIYSNKGNYAEALENFFAALKIREEIGDKKGMAYSYYNIGDTYAKQGNYPEALENLFVALKIREEIGNKQGMVTTYISIGFVYKKQGNYPEARKYLDDGLALSKKIGIKLQIKQIYENLSRLDSTEGHFAQALEHYKMYTLYKDSLWNEESTNQIARMKIQYETEKKDREIDLLNKDKALKEQQLEKQKLVRNGMIAGALLIVVVGLLIFRSFRLRKKLEKQKAIVQERHRISADLHDDVGSGLSKITLLSELLKKQAKTPENRKEAEKISETALELSSTISEIIWALNSNNDYLESMVAYIRRYAAEYFEDSPVKLKVVTQGKILPTPINGERRRNIFYTVKEALNNIMKHAQATEAELKFVVINDKLEVIISDNGKGLPDGELNRFGNGINNMRARMKNISGDFKIESQHGTRIILNLAI